MISVVIPTLDAEAGLPATLSALVPAAVDGLVRDVIVVDGGSADATVRIADEMGATVLVTAPGRGHQLAEGARHARTPWLLFLHADTELAPGWEREVADFMRRAEGRPEAPMAAAFTFALDDLGMAPRLLEALVRMRCLLLALPYGDQGLLISRHLYESVGGYKAMPLMEDVDMVRRLGRRRIAMLRTQAVTSAARFVRDGYLRRVARNQLCLALHLIGAPSHRIARLYGPPPRSEPPAGTKVKSA